MELVILIIIIVVVAAMSYQDHKVGYHSRNLMPRDGNDPVWNRDELDDEGGD